MNEIGQFGEKPHPLSVLDHPRSFIDRLTCSDDTVEEIECLPVLEWPVLLSDDTQNTPTIRDWPVHTHYRHDTWHSESGLVSKAERHLRDRPVESSSSDALLSGGETRQGRSFPVPGRTRLPVPRHCGHEVGHSVLHVRAGQKHLYVTEVGCAGHGALQRSAIPPDL